MVGEQTLRSVAVWMQLRHLQKWLFESHLHVNVFCSEASESQIRPCRLLFAIKLLMLLIKLSINFCWLFSVIAPQIKVFTITYLFSDESEINLDHVKLNLFHSYNISFIPYKISTERMSKMSILVSDIFSL